ncbi:Uncharacterised protein [Sebaldella termitidis]|uniref:Uncharacterized protein n=1 Tax=Sebaldella termitidis (strain ATCC 33386 / NCTC 11300) TaxID=526218 RepID=D1AN72_SEBTE|nr:hypothetical protein [Sebaldella termitidis]ACZ09676.1 hypothetical protein Sterm_2832 [Sebaldella termitidis ATCC 33386]SUI25008.1 Uncharacterised protein [Sebaldella termitidis]
MEVKVKMVKKPIYYEMIKPVTISVGMFSENNYKIGKGFDAIGLMETLTKGTNRAGRNHSVTIPGRPILQSTLSDNQEQINKELTSGFARVSKGSLKTEDIGHKAGKKLLKMVRLEIYKGYFNPGNAESTTRKKGFDMPFYETGTLAKSLGYKVNNKFYGSK